MSGVDKAAIDLGKVALFSHGTTVATNALITRRLPRTAMVCTKGFRDVIEIRRANKEELWDTYKDVVRPYVPRRDRLVVAERIDAQGAVVTPLDEAGAREVARILKRRNVARRRGVFHERLHERRQRAAHEADPAGGDAGHPDLDLVAACCRKSSSTSVSPPPSPTRR